MVQYALPTGMRYSTLQERREFYVNEFGIKNAVEWFRSDFGRVKFAVIMGRHTNIYLEKYKEDAETTIIIDEYRDEEEIRQQIIDFLPEAVYYDRNIYDKNNQELGQELAFDLDPENITCPIHGTLADKMKRKQGLSFCELELNLVKKEAIGLYELLEKKFSEVRAVYSGRGFHLHVFDKEAYKIKFKDRLKYAREIKQQGFHIDEWVTSGESRLIRLPYSLNGLVSRIVIPLKKEEIESFDALNDRRCMPEFLKA